MTRKKGFTMVELMIVIAIVAILASVVTPMLRGRLEKAKWSEAMAGCSAISTSLRAWAAENAEASTTQTITDIANLGFQAIDLQGKYFVYANYDLGTGATYNPSSGVLSYTITVTPTQGNAPSGGSLALTQTGTFTLTDSGGAVTTF